MSLYIAIPNEIGEYFTVYSGFTERMITGVTKEELYRSREIVVYANSSTDRAKITLLFSMGMSVEDINNLIGTNDGL